MSESWRCVVDKLPEVVARVLGIDESVVVDLINTGRLKIAPTPDPKMGDFGVAVHPLLKNIERSKWSEIGSLLATELYSSTRDECWVEKVEFVNGYLNITINYHGILRKLVEDYFTGKIFRELESVGNGEKVVVEHTSANPVHPLHIGSGRNSVIGDTFARLLSKLGFNVETRFYVNDMGRQVATLVYGAKIVESSGISIPGNIKPDHWYGAIYALTNILIEKNKLEKKLRDKINQIIEKTSSLCNPCLEGRLEGIPRELCFEFCSISWRKNYRFNTKKIRDIYRELKKTSKTTQNPLITELKNLIEEYKAELSEYIDFAKAETRLAIQYPELHSALKASIRDYREAEEEINKLMQLAESGDSETISLFRRIIEPVLNGFKETLNSIGIHFNGFDFESNPEVVKTAHEIVEGLLKRGYAKTIEGGAVEVNLDYAAEVNEKVLKLFHPDRAGRFIVRRSDGTTLYVTRDIAYTLYKFRELGARRVYNVIAIEQTREQKQLKAVLYLLGYEQEADNLHHFAYEMVHLKGMRMSGRRGVYYTIDEMLVDAKTNILKKLFEKQSSIKEDSIEIAEKLAVSNVRAILVSVDPSKVLVFNPEKIGEVEYGTIIQYAFVRAQGVVRNLWGLEFLDNPRQVVEKALGLTSRIVGTELTIEEKKLVEDIFKYPSILRQAYSEMSPNKILEYALNLALDFNKFYEKYPVVSEKDENKKYTRAAITVMTLILLSELMDILGFPKLRKM